jgi:hypothetical protein
MSTPALQSSHLQHTNLIRSQEYVTSLTAKVNTLRKQHTHLLGQISQAAKTLGQVSGHNQSLRSELVLLKGTNQEGSDS